MNKIPVYYRENENDDFHLVWSRTFKDGVSMPIICNPPYANLTYYPGKKFFVSGEYYIVMAPNIEVYNSQGIVSTWEGEHQTKIVFNKRQ